jgi:hypothetical protein
MSLTAVIFYQRNLSIWVSNQEDFNVVFLYYYYMVCEAIGTAATSGLLCQARVIMKMIVEKQMQCRLAGETEVLGENLPRRYFCPSQNPTCPDPGLNPGRRGGKPATNRLNYGTAFNVMWAYRLVDFPVVTYLGWLIKSWLYLFGHPHMI